MLMFNGLYSMRHMRAYCLGSVLGYDLGTICSSLTPDAEDRVEKVSRDRWSTYQRSYQVPIKVPIITPITPLDSPVACGYPVSILR